ncbi:unnamed protein product [Durusdinium trenchii]|uniref:Uncharacterized protein n=2 Tax=Durusdinium trenchii TaxID=1381693 RepID=A0ABP0KXY2_9DINO
MSTCSVSRPVHRGEPRVECSPPASARGECTGSTGKDDDEFADAEEMPKTRDASETPSPPTYILSNRLSPRTSFDDAHFGVADYQMQQAALTKISPRPMPPNVVNQCTYTRMAAAGSFCCDAKDADYGLSDEQLEAKNRLTQAAAESQAAGGVVTEGYQTLSDGASSSTSAPSRLTPVIEAGTVDDVRRLQPLEHFGNMLADVCEESTASSLCSIGSEPSNDFSIYRFAGSHTPFTAPFLDRRPRGMACWDRLRRCFMA